MSRRQRRQSQNRYTPSSLSAEGAGSGFISELHSSGMLPIELATAAAFNGGATFTSVTDDSIPKEWKERGKKAWQYYIEEPLVKHCINAWRSFAVGDEIRIGCSDEEVAKEAQQFAAEMKLSAFVRDMILQLLTKGDAVGFKVKDKSGADILELVSVNPLSVEPKYEDGKLTEVTQQIEDDNGRAVGTPKTLPPEQVYHGKWDSPNYATHGNSMVLPAFPAIDMLRDYRRAERAIAKRWATPLRFIKVGGAYGSKLVMPDQAMLNQISQMINKMDPKTGLVVPFYVTVETYGTEGEVLKIEEKVKEVKEDVIVALGMSRSLVTGDGPNFATASISFQKMLVMIKDVKQFAKDILDWVFKDWREAKGYEDKPALQYGFNDLDPSDAIEFKKMLLELYDRKLISKRTMQMKMELDPDLESTNRAQEQGAISLYDLLDEKLIKPMTELVTAGVVTPEAIAKLLNLTADMIPKAPVTPAQAAQGGAYLRAQAAEDGRLCGDCKFYDDTRAYCPVLEEDMPFGSPACRFIDTPIKDVQPPIDA